MIAYLNGKIKEKQDRYLTIGLGPIGLQVFVTDPLYKKAILNREIKIYTFLYSREDTIELYGFEDKEELLFFQHLISISGIGPKSAMGVLSLASPKKLREAVTQGRAEILTKVSGVGRKTAERIIVELRGKIESESETASPADEEVIDALAGLGYPLGQIREAIRKIPADIEGVENRIKQALKLLSK